MSAVGAEQVVYSGFLELFLRKQLTAAAKNDATRTARVNRNSEVAAQTAKQWAETHYEAL